MNSFEIISQNILFQITHARITCYNCYDIARTPNFNYTFFHLLTASTGCLQTFSAFVDSLMFLKY